MNTEQMPDAEGPEDRPAAGNRSGDPPFSGPAGEPESPENPRKTKEGAEMPEQNRGARFLPGATAGAVFTFEGQAMRTMQIEGEAWVVTNDVCNVLGIANPWDAIARLDEDEKGLATTETLGGPQQMNVVNESGLYSLIFTSRKPQAKLFRRWVTGEVLPAIRKTGRYEAKTNTLPPLPDDEPTTTVSLPHGRFIVTIGATPYPHVHRTEITSFLNEGTDTDVMILSHTLRLIEGWWNKVESLRSVGIDTTYGFAMSKLEKAIQEGSRVARHHLASYERHKT